MFEKILVCLDGSKSAEQILPYVESQALKFSSKVILLQVADIPTGKNQTTTKQTQKVKSEGKAYLKGIARPLQVQGVEVECVVLQSRSIGEAIVDYANENKVDLIAISKHSYISTGQFVFGSVADFILDESELPTLVIKRKS